MDNKRFIWLNAEKYPEKQKSFFTTFCERENYKYTVAGFTRKHNFDKSVKEVSVNIFADTKYLLYINGKCMGVGPALPGGDYGLDKPMPVQYYNSYTLQNIGKTLEFYVRVQLLPEVQCEVSCGRGGLWAEYAVTYEDGTSESFSTDEAWSARPENQYVDPEYIDFTNEPSEWENASLVDSVWNLKKSPLLNLEEIKIAPVSVTKTNDNKLEVQFDKIYGGYICMEIEADTAFDIKLEVRETGFNKWRKYNIRGNKNTSLRLMRMESIGELNITYDGDVRIKEVYLMFSHYPIKCEGSFSCSDNMLNKIYAVGKHTTDICRQSIELDSPMHQENLGCTGDYFIESHKGMKEAWGEECQGYGYDHSHAWGATPSYQLPSKLSGLKILEAGLKKYLLLLICSDWSLLIFQFLRHTE